MNAPLETLPTLRGLARLADLRPVIVTDPRADSAHVHSAGDREGHAEKRELLGARIRERVRRRAIDAQRPCLMLLR